MIELQPNDDRIAAFKSRNPGLPTTYCLNWVIDTYTYTCKSKHKKYLYNYAAPPKIAVLADMEYQSIN